MREARVEIRLLGELEVFRAGRSIALPPSKKTRALLAYLAVTARSHTRETLCDLLWQGPDDPRAALRWSLTKLRGVLGEDVVRADRERVELADFDTDLLAVRAAIGTTGDANGERLRSAAGRFRGELLEGLVLSDCYRFQEWCTAEREAARSLRIRVLQAVVRGLAKSPEEALPFARQRVAVDPMTEAAHAAVIRLLAELGRKREALAQYETCSRILSQELGSKPSADLLEARTRIGAAPNVADVAEAPPPRPAPERRDAEVAGVSTCLGRAVELAALEHALDRARAGASRRVVLLLGEPGIGKSRLLQELATRARSLGGLVAAGRAFEAEMIRPYGPWIDALRGIPVARVPEGLRSELAVLLPELGGGPAVSVDRTSVFDAVVRLLVHLSRTDGLVVVELDDLQWFDEASAALLHYTARAVSGTQVLIACAARPGELSDNPAALRLVRALDRDARSEPLELGPLTAESSAALARALVPGVDVERIVRDGAGNPLFVLELTRALDRGDGSALETLGGLISERLERLDDASRDLVAWAAALGKSFDLGLLERVTGAPALDLFRGVAELERRGIVRVSSDGKAHDFVHDLVRAGAYRQLSEPTRRIVHAKIARALDGWPDADDSLASEVVHHATLGGEGELAVRAALRAALRCLRVFARAEAARLADVGLRQVGAIPVGSRLQTRLALLRVIAISSPPPARRKRLADELTRAVAEAQDAALHAEAAGGLDTLATVHFEGGDFGGAHQSTLQAAEASRGSDPLSHARQLAHSARCLGMLDRDMDQVQTMYEEAHGIAAGVGVRFMELDWSGGLLHGFMGDIEAAVGMLEGALAFARSAEARWEEYECLRQLLQLELEAGRMQPALARCAALSEVASRMSDGSELTVARALTVMARLGAGEPDAGNAMEGALSSLRDIDARGMLSYALTFAAQRDLAAGRIADALRRATEAVSAADAVHRPSQASLARAVLSLAALADGDPPRARRALEQPLRDLALPARLSARARAAVEAALHALDAADA
jgi:DNA-binding SARP family transcriptional activator